MTERPDTHTKALTSEGLLRSFVRWLAIGVVLAWSLAALILLAARWIDPVGGFSVCKLVKPIKTVCSCDLLPCFRTKLSMISAKGREPGTSKSRHTEAQMIGALKQLEAGRKVEDVAREVAVSKHTLYAWKAKYGGTDVRQAQEAKSCVTRTRNCGGWWRI